MIAATFHALIEISSKMRRLQVGPVFFGDDLAAFGMIPSHLFVGFPLLIPVRSSGARR